MLVGIFSILLLGALIAQRIKNRPRFGPFLAGHAVSDIASLDIEQKAERVVISRERGGWFITEPYQYRALNESVESLIDKFLEMTFNGVISTRKEKHGDFGVDDEYGTKVVIKFNKRDDVILIFGKRASDRVHVYVRQAHEDTVYLGTSVNSSDLRPNPSHWEDKRIVPLLFDEITGIELVGSFRIIKKDDIWSIEKEKESLGANSEMCDQYVRDLINLTAGQIIRDPQDEDYGFGEPLLEINLHSSSGQYGILVGKQKEDRSYYVKNRLENTVFIIPEMSIGILRRQEAEFTRVEKEEDPKQS